MEQHGSGGTGEEGSLSDPGTNTTGMEASMSRLGLGGGGSESYPERPDEPDCVYYLRTGVCGYGSKCQFNHPPNRPPVSGDLRTEAGEVPERMGQPVCQGEKECPYYMRTGQCKFGSTCKFHHPVPPGDHQAPSQHPLPTSPPAIYPSQQFGVVVPRPYVTYSQMVLSPGMVGWNPYQPSTGTQPSPVYGTKPLSPSAPAYQSGSPSSNKEQSFPQRPGQPECTYFLRTGDCKYGTSCRYHHPLEAASPKGISLSHIGLPLRPGTAQCSHFAQHGICKLGPACKFDHSSSLSTLAPSLSSSSDQGTEVHSSSSIKPKTTASGESETVAAGVSSSSSMTGGVSNSKPAESKNGDSAKHSG
ncbi:Zinc finger CCCH domain-containing protein 58 [Raphanus sativus]|nr:Zinc finger CCCH domain-containing protein 58 [Raphanus sativus]